MCQEFKDTLRTIMESMMRLDTAQARTQMPVTDASPVRAAFAFNPD